MQAGFTLVETGFTRSKTQEYNNEKFNGFCIGSVAFWAIGYSLMYGTSIGSVIGTPSWF
jgi:Amt family ammonium transporter